MADPPPYPGTPRWVKMRPGVRTNDHAAVASQARAHRACRGHGRLARCAYLVMEPAAWFVLVPLAFASLLSGIIQALGTPWGLFRHYWVLFKLLIAVFITIVLLIYMQTFAAMAAVAADPGVDLAMVRNASPELHAALALLALLVALVLAIYKPRGLTRYGWRKQHEERALSTP